MKKQNLKKLCALMSAALIVLSGCGGNSGGKEPAAKDVVKAVAADVPFTDNMDYVAGEQFYDLYRIEKEKVTDASMYVGTMASAEEITVIRVKDAADVQLAKDAMNQRIEDQRNAFTDYIPEELVKLDNAQIYTHGTYVMLVVADDTSKAESAFNDQF